MPIFYRDLYRYQLYTDCVINTGWQLPFSVSSRYIRLDADGTLTIREGYAWDGASGGIDTKNFMRGSLVHDALYQLMREGLLPFTVYREKADELLRKLCLEDGMSSIRAWWVYQGVRFGGGPSADPANDKPILEAP